MRSVQRKVSLYSETLNLKLNYSSFEQTYSNLGRLAFEIKGMDGEVLHQPTTTFPPDSQKGHRALTLTRIHWLKVEEKNGQAYLKRKDKRQKVSLQVAQQVSCLSISTYSPSLKS